MARTQSSASIRSNQTHHVPDGINLAALQGATLAFTNKPSKEAPSQGVKNRIQTMGTAVFPDIQPPRSHHHDAPSRSLSPSDADSIPAPEAGSVKDKIGRFVAHSRGSSPLSQNNDNTLEDVKLPVRSRTPQLVAARLAAERSPVRNEKKPAGGIMHAQSRQEPVLAAPKPIRNPAASSPALQNLLREDREPPPLPQKPPVIPRKPVMSPTSSSSNIARIAATRSTYSPSPTPSSQKLFQPPLPPRSSTFPTAPQNNDVNDKTTNDSRTSLSSRPLSPRPALPPRPRPNGSPVSRGLPRSQGIIMQDLEPSKPIPTPSMASLSTASHNNSSTSTLDKSSGMDTESLSDAIVASSIASSHAPPSKKIPPPPPKPRRRSRSRSILNSLGHFRSNSNDTNRSHSRLPSPPKGMRQTLRDPPKPEPAEQNHHHLLRHPHKHHEGDRKRWQSAVGEQERKRYEGVWAANKGHLIPIPPLPSQAKALGPNAVAYYQEIRTRYPTNTSDMVLNLVVRDIWSRSRLSETVLSQIWNLVDRQKNGLLDREEFVVGMWLIDQSLKGHKLPFRVPDSVWDSVRRLSGVKPPSLV
ncbi:protein irs4 [Aspergillus glaucus CBS 516.65]|uniref:EH domain-containing protein n=1 Tax=Aspergillus glaucus CBS 516.65 TaxID=1160497 RepID=A0A1L9VBV6_ASPGL|nr:hypothetical protein ASPGLDRAFT_50385 [Aspergillus glaucus CBS 516.65]OJJ81332.1 hypothetical protein ASPGLDRAFT_50385 [Aspergillus glaucus CBS 516.65]